MSNIELKPGDIGLARDNSLTSRIIRYFMSKYRRKIGLPKRELYSRAFMIVKIWDEMYIAEAMGDKVKVVPFNNNYKESFKNIKVLTPKKEYSKTEAAQLSKIVKGYCFENARTEPFNFIYYINYIRRSLATSISKYKAPNGKKAKEKLYSSEAIALWANNVRPSTFKFVELTNTVDIDINKYYKVKYDGTSTKNKSL